MNTDLPIHRISTAKAVELADLLGIKADLQEAAEAMRASVLPESEKLDRSLYIAALLLCRRCFKNAIRHPIRNEHHIQINGSLDYHQYWINAADKYAAHSVNAFEKTAIGVVIIDDKVMEVAWLHMIKSAETEEGVEGFIKYIVRLIEIVIDPMIKQLSAEVLKEAGQVSISQHRRAEKLALDSPLSEQAGLARNPSKR